MNTYYKVKIKYNKAIEGGRTVKITGEYLFHCLTYSEVEQRVSEELSKNLRFEFQLLGITKTNISDVLPMEGEFNGEEWFNCKIKFQEFNDTTGRDKYVSENIMVFARDANEAYKNLEESLNRAGAHNCSIVSIIKTNVLDIF